MLAEDLWKTYLLKRYIIYSQCYASFFQVKIYFFHTRATMLCDKHILFYKQILYQDIVYKESN